MSSSSRGALFWVRAWLPVLIGVGVIAMESTEFFGADHTSQPLRNLYQALFGAVNDDTWSDIHHIIRKSGHFIGYGLIGLAWLRAWWITLPHSRFLTDAALALVGTAIIASCDEIHQSTLSNRTGVPSDVLLDCCGAIALQLIVYVIMRMTRPKRLARAA